MEEIKIETYWNVNFSPAILSASLKLIKIETYWNVNDNHAVRSDSVSEY